MRIPPPSGPRRETFGLSRRRLLQCGASTLAGASFLPSLRGLAQSSASTSPLVETSHGRLRGLHQDGVLAFKGVPYAGAVSGPNRFRPAPPLTPWSGVREATALGAPSPQLPGGTYGIDEPAPSEDCLTLNVWTPATEPSHHARRPVLFYCHGGGFSQGSAGAFFQDGANLAREYDVVVVETNHRLGLLGYLYLGELAGEEYASSGTLQLSDLRDGLRWVRDNIAAFGGDPGNVTIFGESGGGSKVSCLLAMPSCEELFHKASIESGPYLRGVPRDRAARTTRAVLAHLGIEASDWRRLLNVPVADLLRAQQAIAAMPKTGPEGVELGPVVGGDLLPHDPFSPTAPAFAANKPLMIGTCRDEANFFLDKDTAAYSLTDTTLHARLSKEFGSNADALLGAYRRSRPTASPTDLYIAIRTAAAFRTDTLTLAERKVAQHAAPVFLYVYTHVCEVPVPGTTHPRGAYHSWDVAFRFDNLLPGGDGKPKTPLQGYLAQAIGSDEAHREASFQTARNLSAMWCHFARTGQPSAPGQPAWPAYTLARRATMMLDATCHVENDPEPLERAVWKGIATREL